MSTSRLALETVNCRAVVSPITSVALKKIDDLAKRVFFRINENSSIVTKIHQQVPIAMKLPQVVACPKKKTLKTGRTIPIYALYAVEMNPEDAHNKGEIYSRSIYKAKMTVETEQTIIYAIAFLNRSQSSTKLYQRRLPNATVEQSHNVSGKPRLQTSNKQSLLFMDTILPHVQIGEICVRLLIGIIEHLAVDLVHGSSIIKPSRT